MPVIRSALTFMTDNVNGNLVLTGELTGKYGEGLRYKTIDGITYQLDKDEVDRLQRFNFTPRYKKDFK